ncbi:uncharacterized protein [Amphiura filiformis]|uniref:uncharacterized protein isoform X2 n=1 Tax=Amphiura filiformis TaxID=82378 RepID=UPI003B22739E
MSLRENLEGFLAHTEHVRNLLARGEDGYQQEFTALKTQSQRYKTEKAYATKAGENENNIRKNRYKDILPFDYTRIKLPEIEGIVGSDYINASTVKGYSGKNTYVAAQAPLPQTVMDFWRMIWDVNATIIVMSCNEYEMGKHKCERYWVDEGEIKDFNDIKVSMISQRRVQPDFLIRTLKVKRGSEEERVINQFHYTAWPDHGVPNSVLPIIDMVKLVREYQPHDDVPLLIHCSAGCGRTGTICVIDFVFNQLKQEAIGADFSLYELVQEMRRQRPAMVQTRDQYELVHRAVAAMFNKQLEEKFDDYSRVYENVHLKPPQMDKPRMPPGAGKVAHSPNQQRKRHSDHNYVNAMPGQIEGDMVRVPTLPGSKGNRPHSIDNASLDVPIYANMRDELEKDMTEAASNSSQSDLTRKHRSSVRKTKEVFSELENLFDTDITPLPGVTTPPPTSPKPTLTNKPSFSKPVVSAKPSNGGGARPPPTAVKPHVNNAERPPIKPSIVNLERPVPMQRKNKPKLPEGKSYDRSVSPQRNLPRNVVADSLISSSEQNKPANFNPFLRSTSTDIRRKSGPSDETSQGLINTKDPAQRSISVGVTDSTENRRSNNNPQIISKLNQVLAGGNIKPSELRPSKSTNVLDLPLQNLQKNHVPSHHRHRQNQGSVRMVTNMNRFLYYNLRIKMMLTKANIDFQCR